MPRAALGGAIALLALIAAGVMLLPSDRAPAPPQDYHGLEREIVRVARDGERLAGRGDTCLQAMRNGAPGAIGLCRGFLDDASRWSQPLNAVSRRLADLDGRLDDATLVAVGASGETAMGALADLAAVTGRLSAQVAEADAWMTETAQAADLSSRRLVQRAD